MVRAVQRGAAVMDYAAMCDAVVCVFMLVVCQSLWESLSSSDWS